VQVSVSEAGTAFLLAHRAGPTATIPIGHGAAS
jgi:hypothetical protein